MNTKRGGPSHKANGRIGHELDSALRYENALLGSAILSPALADKLKPVLQCLLLPDNLAIGEVIVQLRTNSQPIDLVTVTAEAARRGVDVSHTATVIDEALPASFDYYAAKVVEAHRQRKLTRVIEELVQAVQAGTIEEQIRLHAEMQPYLQATETATSIQRSQDIPDLFGISVEDAEPVVTGLIDRGTVVMLVAEAGTGKSFLSLRLAVSVALGASFLGRQCTPMAVLILDAENPLRLVQRRLRTIAGGPIPNIKVWGSWLPDAPALIGDPRLVQIARDDRPLLIFDSFVRFHSQDENSSTEMRAVMQALRSLANAGATPFLIHHRGKAQLSAYRGSSDILAGVDTAFALGEDDGELRLTQIKSRDGAKLSPITIRADFAKGTFQSTELRSIPPEEQHQNQLELLQSIIRAKPGITQNAIIERSGLRRAETISLLKAKEGTLWRAEDGPRKARLYFPLTGSRRPVPTDSGADSQRNDPNWFPELVPEECRTGSHADSHWPEPVDEDPLVPTTPPPIRGSGTVGGTGGRQKSNGRTDWNGTEFQA